MGNLRRVLLAVSVVGLFALGAEANLLQNPGFEDAAGSPIPHWTGVGLGPGYIPFSADSAIPPFSGALDASHIDFGGGPDEGYIYQQVSITPGTELLAMAYAISYSGSGVEPADWHTLGIGLDPYGGTDYFDANVVKNEIHGYAGQWLGLTLPPTNAQASTVTVFLYSKMQDANAAYWAHGFDDAELTPEPSTLALLSFAGLGLIRRKRR